MEISVVIVNFNVRDFLNNALVSLTKALDGIESEIIVVDNASDDGSVEHLRSHFHAVTVIANRTNVGFAAANNIALTRARGKYLLLINPDTVVQEDTVKQLLAYLASNPAVGMVGCKILNPDGTVQLACRRSFPTPWVAFTKIFGLSTLFPASKLFARYNLTYLDPDQVSEVDAISGSFMMLRREVYEKIGGLDETFFMYGEDLDWCFRTQQAGWKVHYVPLTSIIHYKGESTRRSNLDEVNMFYGAMRSFVRKHYRGSIVLEITIRCGILLRRTIAVLIKLFKPFSVAIVDIVVVCCTIFIGEYFRKGALFTFPPYAYPWALIVPAFIVVLSLHLAGVYTSRRLSVSRSFVAVIAAFVVISSLTAFIKDYAFSRIVMILSGILSSVAIPGWRLIFRLAGFGGKRTRQTIFGRRTLIIGVAQNGQEILKKLRSRGGGGYTIVGFIDVNRQRLGEKILDVEIVGSIDTLEKAIDEYRVSEIIFSADAVPYATMLSIIGKNKSRFVNYRLVPSTTEVIIGKPSIDYLDEIPFIELEYKIGRLGNRMAKRSVDIAIALFLLISVVPFVYCWRLATGRNESRIWQSLKCVPKILGGSMSFVGYSWNEKMDSAPYQRIYGTKPGLTGIVQIHNAPNLSSSEKEQLELFYAKNQSFLLDIEILVKTLQVYFQSNT